MTKKITPQQRRKQLLAIALHQAEQVGFQNVTRLSIATEGGVAVGTVSKVFGTMPNMKRDIMRAAIHVENLTVLLQGIVANDPHALKAPEELQQKAKDSLK